jgi:hypothetical protein
MFSRLWSILVFLLLAGVVQADPSYLLDGNKFVSKTYGFSVPIPNGWGAEPVTEADILPVIFVRPSGRAQAIFLVFSGSLEQRPLPTGEEMEKVFQKRFRGFQVTKTKDLRLSDNPFREYIATGSAGQRGYKVYAGQVGSQLFLVCMACNQEVYSQAAAEFSEAMQKIKFEPREPEKGPSGGEG